MKPEGMDSPEGTLKNINLYGFIALYGALFLVILFKVLHVPVTTDELPTVSFYSRFSCWEIMMYPDNIPNNHILNTLLAKFCMLLFGKEQWAIRLPNLISFLFFAGGVYFILKLILPAGSPFFLPGAILFVNPYLLDFFGLCRGYGISITLVTLSAGFLLAGYLSGRSKYLWLALFASMLASYANFTCLVVWVSVTSLVWFQFFIRNTDRPKKIIIPTLLIVLVSAAYLALIMTPIRKIHSTNEFQYWTSHGFYAETIGSLVNNWFYGSGILSRMNPAFFTALTGIATAFIIGFFARLLIKHRLPGSAFIHPAFVSFALLLLPALVNFLQTKILGTPNLNGRTALFFYPLIAMVFVVAISLLPGIRIQWFNRVLALMTCILLLANLSHRISLKSVREWDYDQNTLEVISLLKEKSNGNRLSLKTNWFFHPSFTFYCETGKSPWIDLQPYDYNIDISTPAEYYYVFSADFEKLKPKFEVVCRFSRDRWLLRQKMH
jgi:hypothetical protein